MVLKTAPKTTMTAPKSPDALAARFLLSNKMDELALGMVRPLPRPAQIAPPKSAQGGSILDQIKTKQLSNPNRVRLRPNKITVFAASLSASWADRKLPIKNPTVIEPMARPIWLWLISNCSTATKGTPLMKTKNAPIENAMIRV